jgi:hypothetical protein
MNKLRKLQAVLHRSVETAGLCRRFEIVNTGHFRIAEVSCVAEVVGALWIGKAF